VDRVALTARGEPREYLLFVPETPGYSPAHPVPLVVFLHGAGGTAAWADAETGWSALAAREGFALALPEGVAPDPDKPPKFLTNPRRWNDGAEAAAGEPSAADDVGFLAAVIDDALARAGTDPRRVYLGGFSNGAGMAFRAAAELAERVAAVAPVAGYCRVSDPRPARPVPTLYVIGTADPLVPPRGGEVRSPWRHRLVRRPPVADPLSRWAAAIGCDPVPVTESDAGGVRVERYPGPTEFRAVFVEGLGHHWPGGKGQLDHRIAGQPSDRFDATAEVWRFFRRHALA
jgi:polyhydroxybutyrate depolymerase